MMFPIEYENIENFEKRMDKQYPGDNEFYIFSRYGALTALYEALCLRVEIQHNEKLKNTKQK